MPQPVRAATVFLLVAAVALFLLFSLAPAETTKRSADAHINDLLEPIRKKHDLPALAAAVVSSKGLVAVGAVGVRRRGSEARVTVGDSFHLGSDTKAMTAALIGHCVETGKLNWETTLGEEFPDLAPAMAPQLRSVTLVHLLAHRSGLPEDFADRLAWDRVARAGSIRQQRRAAVKLAAAEPLNGKPGENFVYSKLNHVLAAAMAEKAAGASWEELIEKQLFAPLGMKSAGFGPPSRPGMTDQPWPHDVQGRPIVPQTRAGDNVPALGPSGRVHCSLPDWAKFIADQLKGARGEPALLRPETYKKLHEAPFPGKPYAVGGWTMRDGPGGVWLAHSGSNTLNFSAALMIPGEDFAVLVAANQGGPLDKGEYGCHEALDALVKRYGKGP